MTKSGDGTMMSAKPPTPDFQNAPNGALVFTFLFKEFLLETSSAADELHAAVQTQYPGCL
jgi:hypothetical protein